MASIRKRGGSYLLVVSMGYTPDGRRRNPQQKTVKPPTDLTPKQTEKWLQEQAMIFEMSCKKLNPGIDRSISGFSFLQLISNSIACSCSHFFRLFGRKTRGRLDRLLLRIAPPSVGRVTHRDDKQITVSAFSDTCHL